VNKKFKIAFATGSRADYGIMRRYLDLLNKDENIELGILATGALLEDAYGHQADLIVQDGFKIDVEFKLPINCSSNEGIIHAMSVALDGFGEYFAGNRYDLLIILGDRYEMLSVAVAAAMHRIPILHIHGGEATFGNYDEFIRHAITKMSLFHFTATEEYRRRVIQLGEEPEKVFYLGALGAENCTYIDKTNVPSEVLALPEKGYFVVLFHPETLTDARTLDQTNELLNAVSSLPDYKFAFIGSNADTHADIIRSRVHEFVNSNSNTVYFENLHTDAYHELLKRSICLIGNSSSGIIEAPSLGIYTVNIGERQSGRVRGNSVIDVCCKAQEIKDAVKTVLKQYQTVKPFNPYYKENSAKQYYKTTLEILKNLSDFTSAPKRFFDLV